MRSLDEWLYDYGESIQHEVNQFIHKLCVPAIEFSLIGILWLTPTPSVFGEVPFLNWATLFCLFILIFYSTLREALFLLGSFVMMLPMLVLTYLLVEHFGVVIINGFGFLFVVSWIGLFIGNQIEGKQLPLLKDLLFFFIGPLWVLNSLFVKLGIRPSL